MVKCVTCGLLAQRDEHGDPREVESVTRESGFLPTAQRRGKPAFISELFCYAKSAEFPQQVAFGIPGGVKRQLDQEHACLNWRELHPGKSPKEHEEMIVLEEIRNRQSLAEEKAERLRQEDRANAEQLRQEDIARSEKHRQDDKANAMWAWRLSMASILISIVLVLTHIWNAYQNTIKNQVPSNNPPTINSSPQTNPQTSRAIGPAT